MIFSMVFLTILLSCGAEEDGFTFDLPEDVAVDLIPPVAHHTHYEAPVGRIFHLSVHSLYDAVKNGFVVKQTNGRSLPHWLIFSKKTATFWGIPLQGDEERLQITVKSLEDNESKHISIQVLNDLDRTSTKTCEANEDNTILTLLLDKHIKSIKPKQRVVALNNLAKFFKLPYSAFSLKPQMEKDDITDSSVVLAGPGNLLTKSSKFSSSLEVQVGCDGRLWESRASLVHNLKQQARDGTIAEVLGLPLYGWRVKTETKPILRVKRQIPIDDYGSGDYEENYYDDYDDEEYNDENNLGEVEFNPPISKKPELVPETTIKSTTATSTSTTTIPTSTHPHRHHHGEIKPSDLNPEVVSPEEPRLITEPAITEVGPTKLNIPKPSDSSGWVDAEYDYDAYDEDDDPVESETSIPDLGRNSGRIFSSTTDWRSPEILEEDIEEPEIIETSVAKVFPTTISSTVTTEMSLTSEIVEDTEPPTVTLLFTEPISSSTTTTETISSSPSSTTSSSTTTEPSTTTETPFTTVKFIDETTVSTTSQTSSTTTTEMTTTTEEATTTKTSTARQTSTAPVTEEPFITETELPVNRNLPEPRNTKPYIEKRLQYQSVTAGKIFRYIIPANTFKDAEDGYNLTLQVFTENEQPLPRSSWLQYNPVRRELYGLPLAEDVSNWVYTIRAIDKKGAFEQDQLTIQVQQHRLERVISHEFIMQIRIEKPQEYQHYVDWALKILRALGRMYESNMSEITVRYINYTSEPVTFVWSNDSLPTHYCPRAEVEELFKKMTANDRGDPSRELGLMLAPDLRIKKITTKDLSICEQTAPIAPVTPTTNFSPILRNPVDKVNATLGELLLYKVRDDTFYDPEDVDPSSLNITLLTADLGVIPSNSWLQFDSKNREFFGIPRKTGTMEYFLLCVDTGGMSAKDSLEVVVYPAAKKQYNVEFSMTIGVPYETFNENSGMQRKFVEKLMDIFEEASPSNFHFLPFKAKRESNFDSTVVYWFNKSLPIDACPTNQIKQLESMLHSDSRSISSRVHRIMGPDFTVSTIKVHHMGNCKPKPSVTQPEVTPPPEETPKPQAENDMMLTLVLPIGIIAIMLFIAFVAACILYRKRRMGKMNVEEDGRQSYGNKGIPVIFQEELEEKPEAGTKAPVILKDEKPPLAPPEYSRSGSVKLEDSEPYQPPPPFARSTDSGRVRPKPTPTYRKPPPYVPP